MVEVEAGLAVLVAKCFVEHEFAGHLIQPHEVEAIRAGLSANEHLALERGFYLAGMLAEAPIDAGEKAKLDKAKAETDAIFVDLIDRIGPRDLTAPQFATLARLYERGPLSQNLLGRLVAMEPANIRDVVLRLKKRRLVTTRRDPDDGRLILVGLTASGLSLVQELLPIEIECTATTLAKLNANEKRILYDLLGRLADS